MMAFIKKLLHKFKRLISYGFVGCMNTLVDYGAFALIHNVFSLNAGVSHGISFMAGSLCGYVLNSNVTFKEGKGRTKAQLLQYLGVDIVLALVSGTVLDRLSRDGVNVYLIKIGITVDITILHYIIFKHLVFRIKKEDSQK
jgi:putative flippase GtrA